MPPKGRKAPTSGISLARALAKDLMRCGWLTPFQLNHLFQGKVRELLLGNFAAEFWKEVDVKPGN